jgi:KUP system potassium uptake protein
MTESASNGPPPADGAPPPSEPEDDAERGASSRVAQLVADAPETATAPAGRRLALLTLTALGIVYGDIGTSPLYAMRECFLAAEGVGPGREEVLGVLSLIFWALTLVISLKYLVLVLRADNKGEGGILALMARVHTGRERGRLRTGLVLFGGLFGASLLYGDGAITPAISVLSAIEGLELVTPVFTPYVLPVTVAILVGLFAVQRRGTAVVGVMFGPVTCVWFLALGALGVRGIARAPEVLAAVDPRHAAAFFALHGLKGVLVLGAVFLVVTGGEALYADMGHFGKRPIRLAWFTLVLPALLLNYFGQGALLLREPATLRNPFFLLAPPWALVPLVLLSTAAVVIASQAIISGAFSLTRQAVHLGFLPRTSILHTSAQEIGQIYVPLVNWLLLLVTLALVLGFRRSSNLAAAYGVAVTTTMVITTALIYVVAREQWGWRRPAALVVFGGFMAIDLAFFGANILKVRDGGWVPLAMGLGIYVIFSTFKRGREILAARIHEQAIPLERFLRELDGSDVARRPGTAVFMTSDPEGTPQVLPHHLKHNGVLQQRVVLLTVRTSDVAYVPRAERLKITKLSHGLVRVVAQVGFMETPTVTSIFRECRREGLQGLHPRSVTFYLGRETLLATGRPGMAIWRERLFSFLSRNAQRPTLYFEIPADRVFEIGMQIEL